MSEMAQFVFIDTAGIRRRGKVSTSAEVFSWMRAERSIRALMFVFSLSISQWVNGPGLTDRRTDSKGAKASHHHLEQMGLG